MNLNENNMSKYVIGKKYSYGTLKSMPKDELIKHLDIAQHNYECVNARLFNLRQYVEKLDKALYIACQELETQDSMLFSLCDEYEGISYPKRDRYEWYHYLVGDVANTTSEDNNENEV